MPEDDETQPSPAEDAGHNSGEGPLTPGTPPEGRPAAEGPATGGGAQAGQPPPGSEPPPPGGYGPTGAYGRPPRLTRRAHGQDRVIGGVAGGIADYFGIDPLLV
ncbi:MAG: PspC domain-containing protein, partial [Actinomycetota bacterium]